MFQRLASGQFVLRISFGLFHSAGLFVRNCILSSGMVSGTAAASEPIIHSTHESRTLRYDSLTLWRGVACLLVVLYHSVLYRHFASENFVFGLLHQFWMGVPIFFVISGYCITASADALRKDPVPVRRFYWRRFRRIFPPYWIWFGIMAGLVYLVNTFVAHDYFEIVNVPLLREMSGWRWFR